MLNLKKIRNKFYIKNVTSLVKLTIKATRYFGVVLPYKDNEKNRLSLDTKGYWIYGFLLITSNVLVFYSLFSNAFTKYSETNPYAILGLSRLIFAQTCRCLSILSTIKNYKKIMETLNHLMEIDEILPLTQSELKKLILIVTLEMLGVLTGGLCYRLLGLFSTYDFSFWNITQEISSFMCLVYYEATQMHFLSYMIWMKAVTESLQKRLKETIGTGDDSVKVIDMKTKKTVLEEVETIRCLYGRIDDMKQEVNITYSLHILLTIASIFIEMVFFVFVNITIFQHWSEIDQEILPILKFEQIALWTLVQVVKLIIVVLICHSMTEKSKRTGVLVHRIYHSTKDQNVRNELSAFSVELLHRNSYITAAGFFNVDFTLLYNMIGAVTMYIIMLIQFRFPEVVHGMNPVKSLCSFV